MKRSLSDGNIQNDSPMASVVARHDQPLSEKEQGSKGLSDSTPVISVCGNDLSYCRSVFKHFHLIATLIKIPEFTSQ